MTFVIPPRDNSRAVRNVLSLPSDTSVPFPPTVNFWEDGSIERLNNINQFGLDLFQQFVGQTQVFVSFLKRHWHQR
jgi:hypothetical protein